MKKPILFFFLFLHGLAYEICTDTVVPTIATPPYTYSLNNSEYFTVYELDNSTGAKCLDGSSYKFYWKKGNGVGTKKFMIFFSGGGYCGYENEEFWLSCLSRSILNLGSSAFDGANGTIKSFNISLSYFSSDENINPAFSNWNKVYLPYCDGTLSQGYREDPININGSELWLRGYNNTISTFRYLIDNMDLFESEEIILAGVSSGGQSLLFWLPYFKKISPSHIIFRAISDAGLFLDVINVNSNCYLFRSHMKFISNYSNSFQTDLFHDCKYWKKGKNIWKCLIPEYIIEDIDVDIFIINSQNDYEFMRTAYGLQCLIYGVANCPDNSTNDQIVKYREKFLELALKLKKNKKNWGFWLRRCIEHYYWNSFAWIGNLTTYNAETNQSSNIQLALYKWYLNQGQISFIDLKNWQDDCPT